MPSRAGRGVARAGAACVVGALTSQPCPPPAGFAGAAWPCSRLSGGDSVSESARVGEEQPRPLLARRGRDCPGDRSHQSDRRIGLAPLGEPHPCPAALPKEAKVQR